MVKEGRKSELEQMEDQLAKMERSLKMRYCQIGKTILEMAESEQKAVDSLVDGIIETRKKIAEARYEKQCPECLAFCYGDSRFCGRCGTQFEIKKEEENSYEAEK